MICVTSSHDPTTSFFMVTRGSGKTCSLASHTLHSLGSECGSDTIGKIKTEADIYAVSSLCAVLALVGRLYHRDHRGESVDMKDTNRSLHVQRSRGYEPIEGSGKNGRGCCCTFNSSVLKLVGASLCIAGGIAMCKYRACSIHYCIY